MTSTRERRSLEIFLIAAFQVTLGSVILLLFVRGLIIEHPEYAAEAVHHPSAAEILGVTLLIGILWIVIAIGMFERHNWSRWFSLILVTGAALAGCFEMIFYRPERLDFTPAFIRVSLWLSVPVSIWWWVVLSLPRVRRQFH